MSERGVWEYASQPKSYDDDDGEIAVVRLENGAIRISITEDKAVDSYNAEFTCSVTLPWEKLEELLRFLKAER